MAEHFLSSPMRVRPADRTDLAALRRLFLNQCQHMISTAGGQTSQAKSRVAAIAKSDMQASRSMIDLFGGILLVCECPQAGAIGMVTLTMTGSYPVAQDETPMLLKHTDATPPVATQLMSLWVEVDHRKRGCGSLLVREGLEWARAKGASMTTLTYNPRYPELGRFYERLGFEFA